MQSLRIKQSMKHSTRLAAVAAFPFQFLYYIPLMFHNPGAGCDVAVGFSQQHLHHLWIRAAFITRATENVFAFFA
jgi:hypothetical protein